MKRLSGSAAACLSGMLLVSFVLPDEAEERTRTVRAVNLIGRY